TNYLGSVLPAQHLQLLTLDEDAYLAGLYADGMRGGAPAPPPERSYDWLVEQNEISILGVPHHQKMRRRNGGMTVLPFQTRSEDDW
ncbi:unnamed protein product, partial [Heterosigma akashiwo]